MPVAAAPVVSKQPSPAVLKRSEAVGCGVVVALLVLILSVGLSLGILQMVNGGLNYAAAGQYAALQRQVDAIGSRASTMEQDIANLRTRLDSMEALGGRVSGLENDTQALRSDLDARAAEIQQLKTQLGQMDGRITQVEQRSQTFSRFLDGLRNLVSGILPNP
jgi:septal ring factor EnvC (AmiA/AmiB activator)